jgi:hypothetical protein
MSRNTSPQRLVAAFCVILALSGCQVAGTAAKSQLPKTTEDGLVLVPDSKADAVYRRPGISLAGYSKVTLLDPKVSFRANWQSDTNHNRMMNQIDDDQVRQMIATGEKLLTEEFSAALTKGGYTVVNVTGPDVLAVRASVVELDVYAPESSTTSAWTKTYTNGSGAATLVIELYDSVTGQLLVRAYDRKADGNDGSSWAFPHSQGTNLRDARFVLNTWAEMLVKGLNRAKEAGAPATAK